jgi:hypothetical protein
MTECPLLTELHRIGWSPLACSQVAGISATRTADAIAGRIPKIPGAVLKSLEPYSDVEQLVKDHAAWFAGLGAEARARALEFQGLVAGYGGHVDGGATEDNLKALRDQAAAFEAERPPRLGSSR